MYDLYKLGYMTRSTYGIVLAGKEKYIAASVKIQKTSAGLLANDVFIRKLKDKTAQFLITIWEGNIA